MSIRRLDELFKSPRRWTSAQWGVLTCLAFYERDSFGYAWPDVDDIIGRLGVGKRRVLMLLQELERNGLAERLGRDWSTHRGEQRWRLTLDPHEARAVPLPLDRQSLPSIDVVKRASPAPPVENPVSDALPSIDVVIPGSPATPVENPVSDVHPSIDVVKPGSPAGDRIEGVMVIKSTRSSLLDPRARSLKNILSTLSTLEETSAAPPATASPRLDGLIGSTKKKLKAETPTKSRYQHVADKVRTLLWNPIRASKLLGLDPPITKWTRDRNDAHKTDLTDAAKILCARSHINDWHLDIHSAVESEWFKHFVLRARA